ncbi:MAG: ABC transporter substrate-binding protein [Hyphomicrobiaceae bacterium]|nr:ABC transporter substrate-binding protein [Hyphomicrobiaceae bacterium]
MTERQRKVRSFALSVLAVLAAIAGAIWLTVLIVKPGPDGRIIIASGGSEGAYNELALQYQKQMAKFGVDVELRPLTGGAATITGLFGSGTSEIDGGFVKGGIAGSLQGRYATPEERALHDKQVDNLLSIGRLFYEPIYVFYRRTAADAKLARSLSDFKGRKIWIGAPEGGAKRIVLKLLNANGVDEKNSKIVEQELSDDAKPLLNGEADVAFLILPPESPKIFKLMRTPDILLMNFADEADAYVSRFPYLSKLVMHQGAVELAPDIPSADITLLSTSVALVVKKSVHSALVSLLADAVMDNPRRGFDRDGEPILFHRAGQFPNASDPEYEVARDAKIMYKVGELPFLLRAVAPFNERMGIPFWVTAYLHEHGTRTLLILIPLLSIALPLARFLPMLYTWTVRRRLLHWYKQMKALETSLDEHPAVTSAQIADARTELDRIDQGVSRIKIPLEFSDQYYDLRSHIDLMRRQLDPRGTALGGVQKAAE